MTLENTPTEAAPSVDTNAEASASEVVSTASPAETVEAAAPSAAAEDTRSIAEKVRDEFHAKFGEPDAPAGQEPATVAPDPAPAPTETSTEQTQDDDKATRLPQEVFDALPPEAKRRMGYLTDQARRARKEAEAITAEVDTYRGSHETLTTLQSYMSDNGMEADDVTQALGTLALFKRNDFAGFIAKMKPLMDFAMEATGAAVTPDVQQLIDSGEITPEAGARLTKAEREAQLAAQRAERVTATVQQRDTAASHAAFVANTKAAVDAVMVELSAQPDFALKKDSVRATFKDLLEGGWRPKTPEAAAQMLRNVAARIHVPTPQPTPQPTSRRPDATTSTQTRAVPKNLSEAIFAGYEASLRA